MMFERMREMMMPGSVCGGVALLVLIVAGCGEGVTNIPEHDLEVSYSGQTLEMGEGIAWIRTLNGAPRLDIVFSMDRDLTCADGHDQLGQQEYQAGNTLARMVFEELDSLEEGENEARYRVDRPGTGRSGRAPVLIDGFDSDKVWGQASWSTGSTPSNAASIRGSFIVQNCVE